MVSDEGAAHEAGVIYLFVHYSNEFPCSDKEKKACLLFKKLQGDRFRTGNGEKTQEGATK